MLAHGKTRSWSVAAALATVGVISAVTDGNPAEWDSPTGGDWHVPAHWNPAGVPTSTTDAHFGLAGTYQVDFSANAQARDLTITQGEINFALGAQRLQLDRFVLNGGVTTLPAFVKGAAGAGQVGYTTSWNLQGGQLRVTGGAFSPAPVPTSYNSGTGTPVSMGNSVRVSGLAGGPSSLLRLTNGAQTSDLQTTVVGMNGGEGNVDIDSGAQFQQTGSVFVGAGAHEDAQTITGSIGRLSITNGGRMTLATGAPWIGIHGGKGELIVDGPGAQVISPGVTAGVGVYQGADGRYRRSHGVVSVTNGGLIDIEFTVGSAANFGASGGSAHLEVRGEGSLFRSTTNSITFGTSIFDSGNGFVRSTGSLVVRDGGRVEALTGGTAGGGRIVIGGSAADGHAEVTGICSSLMADLSLLVGASGLGSSPDRRGEGELLIADGGVVETGTSVAVGGSGNSGIVHVGRPDGTDLGGSLLQTFSLRVALTSTDLPYVQGRVWVNPGGSAIVDHVYTGTSLATPENIRVHLAGGTIQASRLIMPEAAHLDWTAGTLHLTGGVSEIPAIAVPSAGLLRGKGTIAGDLAINPGGKLGIELRSISNFDAFVITGTQTTIAGDLELTLAGSFVPAASDVFTILSGTSMVSGSFANASFGLIPLVGGGGGFEVAYAASSVVLSNFLRTGDVNGDGAVNNLDIAAFVGLLTGGGGASGRSLFAGDVNGDGAVNNLDIAPFVALLTGGRPIEGNDPVFAPLMGLVPEPASLGLLALLAPLMAGRRRGPR